MSGLPWAILAAFHWNLCSSLQPNIKTLRRKSPFKVTEFRSLSFQPSIRRTLIQKKKRQPLKTPRSRSLPLLGSPMTRKSRMTTKMLQNPVTRRRRSAEKIKRKPATRMLASERLRARLAHSMDKRVHQRSQSLTCSRTAIIPKERFRSTRWMNVLLRIASRTRRRRRSIPPKMRSTRKFA